MSITLATAKVSVRYTVLHAEKQTRDRCHFLSIMPFPPPRRDPDGCVLEMKRHQSIPIAEHTYSHYPTFFFMRHIWDTDWQLDYKWGNGNNLLGRSFTSSLASYETVVLIFLSVSSVSKSRIPPFPIHYVSRMRVINLVSLGHQTCSISRIQLW